MTKCIHITRARVCASPELAEEPGIVFCTDRATCQFKDEARQRHLATLTSIAARGDRYGYRAYLAQVASAEGAQSAEILKRVFIASRETKAPTAD